MTDNEQKNKQTTLLHDIHLNEILVDIKNSNETYTEDYNDRIKRYLDEGKSLKYSSVHGLSFLMYCICIIEEELAINIIQHGIDLDINYPWDHGQTPLHVSCQMSMLDFIQALFIHRSTELDIYAITDDMLVQFNDFQCGGKTALHYAASNGNLEVIQLLLTYASKQLNDKYFLLNMKDFQNNTALDCAIISGKLECAKYLYSLSNVENDINGELKDNCNEWIEHRTQMLSKKRIQDSRQTRKRFEYKNELILENASSENQLCSNSKKENIIVDECSLDISDGKLETLCKSLSNVFVVEKYWTEIECYEILQIVKEYGDRNGWTSNRHRSYSTIDIPVHSIHYKLDEFIRENLALNLFPQIIDKFQLQLQCNVDDEYFEIGVRDLFFVKYHVLTQNALNLHRDGSLISFNILLNDVQEFDGGGTYFKHLDEVITIGKGDCVLHSGKVLHAGNAITRGERFLLVGFLEGKVRTKKMKQKFKI